MINELTMKFVAGGTLITVISLLSKSRYPYVSGLFMMFPAITLIGYYFVSGSVTSTQLREITIYSLYSVLTVVVFIISFYYFQSRYEIVNALIYSLFLWFLSAGIIISTFKYLS